MEFGYYHHFRYGGRSNRNGGRLFHVSNTGYDNDGCDNRELAKLYLDIINRSNCDVPGLEFLSGEEFYTRAGRVRVCVVTGERRRFANLIIRKGVL